MGKLKNEIAFELYIPMHVLSGNKFTNQWAPGSRYFYKNYRKKWWRALSYMIPKVPADWNIERIIRAEIIRIAEPRKKEFDLINYAHGCKPIPDLLKDVGWIKDDAPRFWSCEYKQHLWKEVDNKILKPGTIIKIFK